MRLYMMSIRKLICGGLIILCLISLIGCETTNDGYAFEDMYAIMMNDSMGIQKYNILTGEQTPLCPDPICEHTSDSECPFASAAMILTDESELYFVQDGAIYYDDQIGDYVLPQSIMRYDFKKGQVKVLCTINSTKYEGLQGRLIHSGNNIYFSVRSADDTNETFDLWKVKDTGGTPKKLGITTSWTAGGVNNGYAYYSDVTGVYRIDMKKKEMEYLLQADEGKLIAIYFFDKDGGAYCVENSQSGSAVIYIKAGENPVRIMEGMDISYMAISGDTICYSEGNDLYTISQDHKNKALLYEADEKENISRIWSCGLGFVARYNNDETMNSTFVPLKIYS